MCRFLMLASPEAVDVRAIVGQFAQMCQRSTSPTGDRQADGWGVAWWLEGQEWHRHRSVEPIWTETQVIQRLPPTCHLVVHARSASFVQHKEQIAYNQPYIWGSYAFVFNGLIQGVRLPRQVPGRIGAQKIWFLVQDLLQQGVSPQPALQRVGALLARHSRSIRACNMGLSNAQDPVVYNGNPSGASYYRLYEAHQDRLRLVSSEPFGGWQWRA